ncbi:titin-like [Aricia agestis]|uniref:titin-like n=1 Tax=Aricia agestis TaxID=91739 RepID=UPI001C20AAAC|nr:titin-like [Aricia agestis]
MTNEANNSPDAPIQIDEELEDIIADECSCVVFECKLSGKSPKYSSYKWYKNGKCIKSRPTVKATANGSWYRLEIISASIEDAGVYFLLLERNGSKVYSYANLYVRPIKNSVNNNNEVIYMNPHTNNRLVEKHLLHTRVRVGETIELEAKFTDVVDECQWYRSNQLIVQNERTIFLNDTKTTSLSILCACETDTGVYQVISKTKHGAASSFASVVVIDTDLKVRNSCDVVPRIIDPMVDEIETNIGEEIRLTCKAIIDNNTSIKWLKKGKPFEETLRSNEDVVQEIYNNEYISLRFLKPNLLDTGEYTLNLENKLTDVTDTSSCYLTVNKSPSDSLSPVRVKKSLMSAMTYIGSRVLFTCSFDLQDMRYYYVVWYIGHYRVERTNHRFNVFSRGGEFFFFIKQVEPGMAGEVICELHMSLPNRKRVLVNKTSSNLVIVPGVYLDQEKECCDSLHKLSIYSFDSSVIIPVRNEKSIENGSHTNGSIYTNGTHQDNNDSLFQITCCRLDETCFYFDTWSKSDFVKDLSIRESLHNTINGNDISKSFNIEWNCYSNIKTKWYVIEFSQSDNDFVKAGVSSMPMFDLKDPPLEQLMNFRIMAIDASDSSEYRVSISPATKELILNKKEVDIRPMEEFASLYTKTGDMIGCGAFGSVVLVKDKRDDFYAAKFLKTRTQKKRDTALREFQIMRNLNHSKLVELIDTFVSKEAFVLVMDYLWGGELFDRIVEEEHIKEVDVVPYVKQICEALQYLHNLEIAHLDLKPENIICLSPNSRQVKIIDFGLARVLSDGHKTRAIYGTKDYVAPEVLNFEQLTLACDMWSLGVVTYMLLSGVMPFSGDTWVQRSANITRANYNYSESDFVEISDLAKDFVDHLLVLQPKKRMSSTAALNHQWILEGPPDGAKAGHMKRARENLKSYLANYRARWQRAGNVMIAAHRLRTHLAGHKVTPHKTEFEIIQ